MNIVTIIIDTLRYDHVGAYGKQEVYTPNLDRLVDRSWNFQRAFAASFPTIPHRTDVLTGRYGAPFHPWKLLDCDVLTIPRALAELGYCSQLIHDTPHLVNGGHNFDFPFDAWMPIRGGEVDRAWITDSWKYLNNWAFDPVFGEQTISNEEVLRRQYIMCCYAQTNRWREKEEDWNVAQLFSISSKFLRDNKSRDNFFLWIDCFDPHEPWDSPPEFMKMYDKTPNYDGKIDPRAFAIRNNTSLSDRAKNRIKAMYKAKVSFVDKWFGVFLDTLEETGLDKNTAILLTADHGTNIGDRNGHFGKENPPCENESHVPFILYVPQAGSGYSEIIVQPQDIFATIMSIAGDEKPLSSPIDSHNVLVSATKNDNGVRKLALAGAVVDSWRNKSSDKVLFSAFDNNWRLGFSADPQKCELQRLGSQENVASDNMDVVGKLHAEAIDEIERRGLDPALLKWLKSHDKDGFPSEFHSTDAHPAPNGWYGGYWNKMFRSFGIK